MKLGEHFQVGLQLLAAKKNRRHIYVQYYETKAFAGEGSTSM